MISLFAFTGMTALLLIEGWLLLGIVGVHERMLRLSLSLPLATLSNTLLLLVLTLLTLPLSPTTILAGHLTILSLCFAFLLLKEPLYNLKTKNSEQNMSSGIQKAISLMCAVLLFATFVYSASHVWLPTFHYDSATNWNMRAKISFVERGLVHRDHHDLVKKPHYPFLFHALEITTQQGQEQWNDRFANVIHFLLAISALSALYFLLRKLKGTFAGLLAITLITTTPLFAMHLGGGYADVPLVLFAVLSLVALLLFDDTQEQGWLLLSAIFVSASVWTKSEGLPFCFFPWLVTIAFLWWRKRIPKQQAVKGIAASLILSLPWPLFALARGVSLSPHGSEDLSIGIQEGAIARAFDVLFIGGSFGVVFAVVLLTTLLVLLKKNHHHTDLRYRWGFLWGLLSLFGILFVYLFTSNAVYLINGQSFDRQLLLPVSLLIVTLVLSLYENPLIARKR